MSESGVHGGAAGAQDRRHSGDARRRRRGPPRPQDRHDEHQRDDRGDQVEAVATIRPVVIMESVNARIENSPRSRG